MIPLARRYSAATCALFVLAAVPVWLHRATGMVHDECARPERLARLDAYGANPRPRAGFRDGGWIHATAITGMLEPAAGVYPLSFGFVRTSDPTEFYGVIENLFFPVPVPADRSERRTLQVGDDVLPVTHVYNEESPSSVRISQYLLVQGVRPVVHPFVGGLQSALQQVVHGTHPVGAFLISTIGDPSELPALERQASAWLAEAWRDYREVCDP